MTSLSSALSSALCAAEATLADTATRAGQAPPAALAALRDLERGPPAAAFRRAVGHAAAELRREIGDPALVDSLLTMLTLPAPAAARFCELLSTEFLLAEQPNPAQLIDHYRRALRPALAAAGKSAPSWRAISPVARLLFGRLLPEAIASQARLQHLLPAGAARAEIDRLRQAQPVTPLLDRLLDDPPSQAIIATSGARIAQVQQTIVNGDMYALASAPAADLLTLFVRYRAFVVEMFGTLDFRGIMQLQAAARISLNQIYIPLDASLRTDPRLSGVGQAARPLHDYVSEQPLLVVLGDPGSGKSTLARYLLTALARGDSRDRPCIEPTWLPILFPVAAFAEARSRPSGGDLSPLAYLSEYYRGLSQPDYGPLFLRALERGHALLLLDGLDEVRDDRPGIVRALDAFVREWDAQGNRFIATSRIVGYDDAPLDPRLFTVVTLLPLDDIQIRRFVERWSGAYERLAEPTWPEDDDLYHDLVRDAAIAELELRVAQHSRSLARAVFADARVADLARNPLLLTILALIHNQGARLPDRRVDLYRLCVTALAETWNRARSLSGRPVDLYLGGERIDERFIVNLLGPVALAIHRDQAGGLVDQDDLEALIAGTLTRSDGLPHQRAQRLAQGFIELMRRDTGLLQERGYRRYGFLHLTFEEYLAARGLLESATVEDPDSLFRLYSGDPRWHEVLRLAVAAAPQRTAQRLLLQLLDAPGADAAAVLLAGKCLTDIGRSGASQRAWEAVLAALLALRASASAALPARVGAATIVGRLGDPHQLDLDSGDSADRTYWRPVPRAAFWCGDEGPAQPGHAAQLHRVTPHYSFAIARYPVTNAQFRQFIEAGGYRERRWWSEHGRMLIDAEGMASPIRQPAHWESPQHSEPTQPVVGVSWYEAAAYAMWLSERGRRAGWLAEDELVRLPTASEWERAARHHSRRRYPWGDQPPDATRAAYADLACDAPVPVGCFPAGAAACGAEDLAGNVWEWTASLAGGADALEPAAEISSGEMPLIRGGAYDTRASDLRCGATHWRPPERRAPDLGFRLVRASAHLTEPAQ